MARRLVWHRRDLRLTDNPLYSMLDSATPNISLYVFDESQFLPRPSTCLPSEWDAVTVGPHAARVLIDAVTDLQTNIRTLGGKLIVRMGNPVEIVPLIASEIEATQVWWNEEPGVYEANTSQRVRQALEMTGIQVTTHIGCTLYHPNDLPVEEKIWRRLAHPKQCQKSKKNSNYEDSRTNDVDTRATTAPSTTSIDANTTLVAPERWEGMPRVMGDFRRAARTGAQVRPTILAPSSLCTPALPLDFHLGDIPTLYNLTRPLLLSCDRPVMGMDQETIELVVKAAMDRCHDGDATRGGETSALKRLHHFIFGGYAATAQRSLADVSFNNSSRLSVHLALGTISPRTIYEAALAAGESCRWLVGHLEMRDFFLFSAFSAGSQLFRIEGSQLFRIEGIPVVKKQGSIEWQIPNASAQTMEVWRRWAKGKTNLPIVDAAMRELLSTGYCSNRVRQNVASVLTKDLGGIDWRAGAEWFQFLLEDHCVGANWGNWMYFAGVGSDPKNRHFRTISQALRYDPSGTYVQKWLPELNGVVDIEARLRPWAFAQEWGAPIVNPDTQLTRSDLEILKKYGRLRPSNNEHVDK